MTDTADTVDSADTDNEALQKELEKTIKTFARLFARMDADGTEGETAMRMLKANMAKINELQEKLTGSRGDLNFVTLLQKIENGGGTDSELAEMYEQQIAECVAANEALKQAETLLRAELERVTMLAKYRKADQIDDININAMAKKALTEIKEAVDKLADMVDPDPEKVEELYANILDEMTSKDLGGPGGKPKFAHRIFAGLIRGMNYPVDADDAVKLQTLAAAQAQALKDTEELQRRLEVLKDTIPALAEALDIAIYQSGTHRDLNTAINEMKAALRTVETMREENLSLNNTIAQMRSTHAQQIAEKNVQISALQKTVLHLDTRMRHLLLAGAAGADPIAQTVLGEEGPELRKKARESLEHRIEGFRADALEWSNAEVLRQRLDSAGKMGYRLRLGDAFKGVTLQDLARENHVLHAALAKKGKAATVEGTAILETYRLIPRDDIQKILDDHTRMEGVTAAARKQAQIDANRAQQTEERLNQTRTLLLREEAQNAIIRQERDSVQMVNANLTADVMEKTTIINRQRTIMAGGAVLSMVFAVAAFSLGLMAADNKAERNAPPPAPSLQTQP